jgi:hypothetical protein
METLSMHRMAQEADDGRGHWAAASGELPTLLTWATHDDALAASVA